MAKVGRPPKYKTPEAMQEVIDQYFDSVRFERDDSMTYRPTMAGLAKALGMSRRALVDYAHKDEFLLTIKKARQEVEQALEEALYLPGVAGVIFNLKNNFGWKDQKEVTAKVSHDIADFSHLTDDEIRQRIKKD